MASVKLKFNQPESEDITKLRIYEGSSKNGSFSQIEVVTEVGVFPNYINEYTTDQAGSIGDWFAIQWEDSKGALSDISMPVQGNTETEVGDIVERVMLRDPSLNINIVTEEAAAAIAKYKNIDDPYALDTPLTYVEKRGLTNLTLAMVYLSQMTKGQASEWVAGIVSMKSSDKSSTSRMDAMDRLLKQANLDLGIPMSVIAQMALPDILPGVIGSEVDQTRLIATVVEIL